MVDTLTKKSSALGRLLSMANRWACVSSKNYMRGCGVKHTWQKCALTKNAGSVWDETLLFSKCGKTRFRRRSGGRVSRRCSSNSGKNRSCVALRTKGEINKRVSNGYDIRSCKNVALRKLKQRGENTKFVSSDYDI